MRRIQEALKVAARLGGARDCSALQGQTFERRAVDQEVARSLRAAQIAPNVRVDPK